MTQSSLACLCYIYSYIFIMPKNDTSRSVVLVPNDWLLIGPTFYLYGFFISVTLKELSVVDTISFAGVARLHAIGILLRRFLKIYY